MKNQILAGFKQSVVLLFGLFVLSACGGSSSGGSDGGTTPPVVVGANLFMTITDANGQSISSSQATDEINITVLARDDFNRATSGISVEFTVSGLGTLSPGSALTGSDGKATVKLVTGTTDLGVATITASATVDGTAVTTSGQIQITELVNTGQSDPVLTLAVLDDTCTSEINTQFAGGSFCLQAALTRDGAPMVGEVIAFTAGLGTLNQSTALTSSLGIATVRLNSVQAQVGADTVSATYAGTTISKNYQFITSQSNRNLTLQTFAEDCVTSDNSIPAGNTFCLRATLTRAGAPDSGQIIQFEVPMGTLRSVNALTNADGQADVYLDSTTETLGAAAARAFIDTLEDTANYEFTTPDDTSTNPNTPDLILTGKVDGVVNNRFTINQTMKLVAKVLDAKGDVVANEIVNYTIENGSISASSALTGLDGEASVDLTGTALNVGAGIATATAVVKGQTVTGTFNYELSTTGSADSNVAKFGYFKDPNDKTSFVEGEIGTTLPLDANKEVSLSAGGTLGLNVVLVDANNDRSTSPTPVTFSSTCQANTQATLDVNVVTINGEARSTYEDVSCATVQGNQDTVIATVTVGSSELVARRTVNLAPENVGSISFVSANPESIVLKGTGGQGTQESSTLTFAVNGVLGNPLSQQVVRFSLDTGVGDLTIDPLESLTNSQGLVSTRVTSGNVPTAVRVTASTTTLDDNEIKTQSDLLSINTGLPDQNSMSLSTNQFNPEANSFNGSFTIITAYLADSFNNPVPDGTTVNFTTEGGQIQPTCNTVNGRCEVRWTAANPRADDHRITVTATAIGHETFFDTNGNNVLDLSDGGPIYDGTDSGITRGDYHPSGFIDHSEAWRDDNENGLHDQGEQFFDFNNNQQFDGADEQFNGPQCTTSAFCAPAESQKLHVRKSLVMIMSGSSPRITIMDPARITPDAGNQALEYLNNRLVIFTNSPNVNRDDSSTQVVPEGNNRTFAVTLADFAAGLGQTLPEGTTISVNTTGGILSGTTSLNIGNTIGTNDPAGYGGQEFSFSITSPFSTGVPGEVSTVATVSINVVLPNSGNAVSFSFDLILEAT